MLQVSAQQSVTAPTNKHNLSTSGPGPVKATTTTEICIFCHTPHNSNPTAPLWSQTHGRARCRGVANQSRSHRARRVRSHAPARRMRGLSQSPRDQRAGSDGTETVWEDCRSVGSQPHQCPGTAEWSACVSERVRDLLQVPCGLGEHAASHGRTGASLSEPRGAAVEQATAYGLDSCVLSPD